MPQRLDFAQWEFANVQLAPIKLKLATAVTTTVIGGDVAAETAARIAADSAEAATRSAADNALQVQITELQQPRYSTNLLLGGM